MAHKSKQISNPKTGQSIVFLQTARDTNGKLLEMESTYNSHSKEPVAHYHPNQEEDFTVIKGSLSVVVEGKLKILNEGEKLHIPKGQKHAMWNQTDEVTIVNWQVRPAMNTEYFLETAMGIATNRKTNEEGMPNLLQIALFANQFADEFRLTKPPYFVQKIVFTLLSPVARLLGYRSTYREYID